MLPQDRGTAQTGEISQILDAQMTSPDDNSKPAPKSRQKNLTPEARRALAEAQERRKNSVAAEKAKEVGGRKGPEPTRYGDWEKDGILSDF